MQRTIEKLNVISEDRGVVMSELGLGNRVHPADFATQAKEIPDDGTEEGAEMLRKCLARALGRPFRASGVPQDMSRGAVQEMLRRKTMWPVDVLHPKMMKEPGVKRWRVPAPQGDHPEQVHHRGHLILITEAEKRSAQWLVRKPRQRGGKKKKSGKGGGKGSGGPPQPKWLKG